MTSAEFRKLAPDVAAKVLGPDRKKPVERGKGEESIRKSNSIGNRWEQDYAAHLDIRKASGEVIAWHPQAIKFRLADNTWYTPDFIVFMADGTVEAVEVKGWARDDAIVKFKVAAETFDKIVWRMVTKSGGRWQTTRLLNGRLEL